MTCRDRTCELWRLVACIWTTLLTICHVLHAEQGRLNSAMSSLAADHDREVCTAAVAVSDLYKQVCVLYLFFDAVFPVRLLQFCGVSANNATLS